MQPITSVWSSFGHRFIGTGETDDVGNPYESCLTCGAVYELVRREDDPTGGDYTAANGDDPMPCTHDTSMAHGYPGERVDGNADHNCNCLLCA
jgi:hypothetical protein